MFKRFVYVLRNAEHLTASIPRGSAALIMVPRQKRTAPVRTLLVEALSKTQVPLKWMLMYDPSSATFYLEIVPLGAGPM